jgi:hypothetical protein
MDRIQMYQEMIKVHGRAATAATLGMTTAALDARVYELKGCGMRDNTALLIQTYSGTTLFAEWVAEQSGGVFVELPSEDDTNEEAIDESMLLLCEQLGDLARTYRQAKADGEIDRKEKADLSHKANDIHATLKKSLRTMFKVFCKQEG